MSKPKSGISKERNHSYLRNYLIIALVAFAVYANALSNEFVFDDESVVLSDPTITNLSNIPDYFTGKEGFHKVIGRYYRPVISTSYAVDCAIWGLKPFGFHLTNILINVINSLLFYYLLSLIFKDKQESKNQIKIQYAILTGALIFAVHPIHTEAVSWVSGRTDSLSFTFFVASFIFYLKYSKELEDKNRIRDIVYICVFYVLSLLTKEMAITLPVVIILYDLIVEKFSFRKIKENISIYFIFFIISVLYLITRWYILRDVPERDTYFYFYGKDFSTVFFSMLQTIPLYLRLIVYPVGLLYHYSGYLPYVNTFMASGVIVSVTLIALITAISIYCYKKQSLITYSFLFFFITLLPVLNIVPTMNFVAERFLYIPSISLSLILVFIFYRLDFNKYRSSALTVYFSIIAVFGILTIMRNGDWKNNDTLFLSADDKPGTVTYVNIGNIYANKGEYDVAERYYRKALDLRAETVLANDNLGKIFMVKGNFDSAFYYINKSKSLDTLSPEPRFALAQLYMKNNMIPQAINELEKLHEIVPTYMNSNQILSELKSKLYQDSTITQQKPDMQNSNSMRVKQLEQDSYLHYHNKDYKMAIKELNELIESNPSAKSSYYNNLGMCYMEQDDLKNAEKYFESSIEANKNFSTAYNNLGQVYEKMGNKEKAKEIYKQAIDIDPNNKDAKLNLEKLK